MLQNAYLLLGSNLGNKIQHLNEAIGLLSKVGKVVKLSDVYITAAWGKVDQPDFLNQAIVLQTRMQAINLIRKILIIEKKMGRVRKEKYAPRIIDIDILFYGQEVYHYKTLLVPHPEIASRKFALVAMANLDSNFVHPVLDKTIEILLKNCKDDLPVSIFKF